MFEKEEVMGVHMGPHVAMLSGPMQSAVLASLPPEVIQAKNGTTSIWRPAPSIMVSQVAGVLTPKAAATLVAAMHRAVAEAGRWEGFHDWEQMTDYTTETRIQLTDAVQSVHSRTEQIHFLLSSPAVSFGVRVANIALGNLRIHATRASFNIALDQALQRHRNSGAPRSATTSALAATPKRLPTSNRGNAP
jgi:hypothetical protein